MTNIKEVSNKLVNDYKVDLKFAKIELLKEVNINDIAKIQELLTYIRGLEIAIANAKYKGFKY